jgi:hypothetical protein
MSATGRCLASDASVSSRDAQSAVGKHVSLLGTLHLAVIPIHFVFGRFMPDTMDQQVYISSDMIRQTDDGAFRL